MYVLYRTSIVIADVIASSSFPHLCWFFWCYFRVWDRMLAGFSCAPWFLVLGNEVLPSYTFGAGSRSYSDLLCLTTSDITENFISMYKNTRKGLYTWVSFLAWLTNTKLTKNASYNEKKETVLRDHWLQLTRYWLDSV